MITKDRIGREFREKLPPALSLTTPEGVDIKRRAARKGRKLIMLPGIVALKSSGGQIGEIRNFESDSPELLVTFPGGGRLSFLGQTLHPRQRFLHISFEKSSAVCKDCFDTLIVFDECRWIGSAEENSEGAPQVVPEHIKEWQRAITDEETTMTFHYGCSSRAHPQIAVSTSSDHRKSAKIKVPIDSSKSNGNVIVIDDNDDEGSRRKSGRVRKAVSYGNEDESDDDQADEESVSDDNSEVEENSNTNHEDISMLEPTRKRKKRRKTWIDDDDEEDKEEQSSEEDNEDDDVNYSDS